MNFRVTPSDFIPRTSTGDFYVRIVPPEILKDFDWARAPIHRIPSGFFILRNTPVPYEEKDFVLIKHTLELNIKGAKIAQVSRFYLAYQGKVYKPGNFIKEKIRAFLKAQGLPLACMAGWGDLLGCLRIVHAVNSGFRLEAEYALES